MSGIEQPWKQFESGSLAREQEAFPFESGGKPAQTIPCGQHAVTRNENGDWISAARAANRAHSMRPPDQARDLPVTARLSARNLAKRSPHALLERAARGQIHWRQLIGLFAGECVCQCRAGFAMPFLDLPRRRGHFPAT